MTFQSLILSWLNFLICSQDQIVNHYCKAGSFTTKVSICNNNVSWLEIGKFLGYKISFHLPTTLMINCILCLQVGLTTNIQNLKWYEEADHFSFFPRSYLLGSDDEKMEFIGMWHATLDLLCFQTNLIPTPSWIPGRICWIPTQVLDLELQCKYTFFSAICSAWNYILLFGYPLKGSKL